MAASLESRAVQVDTSVRHQLASPWTWSELRSDKKEGESWSHLRYNICTVDTVEDFWKAWTNIVKPTEAFKSKEGTAVITREDEDEDAVDAAGKRRSRSSRISQLAVFKDDIEPLGEYNDHKTNLMRLRMRSSTLREVDMKHWEDFWLRLLCATVGGSLDEGKWINGLLMDNKSHKSIIWRLEVWLNLPFGDPNVELVKDALRALMKDRGLSSVIIEDIDLQKK